MQNYIEAEKRQLDCRASRCTCYKALCSPPELPAYQQVSVYWGKVWVELEVQLSMDEWLHIQGTEYDYLRKVMRGSHVWAGTRFAEHRLDHAAMLKGLAM